MDDTNSYNFNQIIIFQIINGFAKISANGINKDTAEKKGWIELQYLGIYPSGWEGGIKFYSEPTKESKILSVFQKPYYIPLRILKCSGEWLYVYVYENGIKKEGWLSPENQCSNPLTTCN